MAISNRWLNVLPFVLVVAFTDCSFWKVGMDPRGKALKAKGDVVAVAATKYIASVGKMPKKTSDLFPNFIDFIPGEEFSIEGSGNEISIVIRYKPTWPQPGQIICSRKVAMPDWSCVGHY
jgi:hypothetical protein